MKSNTTPVDTALLPTDPATDEPLPPRSQPGYYPGFSTLSQKKFWDAATRKLIEHRVQHTHQREFFSQDQWDFWTAVFDHLIPQTDRTPDRQIPLVPVLDHRLHSNQTVGYRFESMPPDREVYRIGIDAIDREAEHRFGGKFRLLAHRQQDLVLQTIQKGKPQAAPEIWKKMSVAHFWEMLMSDALEAYYAHPWAWDEIGFGGPAYPRAYTRLERGEPEPWEVEEQRYEWRAPAFSVSEEIDTAGEQEQSHHGSGGTH